MTSSPAPDLDELERLGSKGHPRPWRFDGDRTILDVPPPDQFHIIPPTVLAKTLTAKDAADAAYIVALVNAAPALLAELRAAREAAAESGRLREALEEARAKIAGQRIFWEPGPGDEAVAQIDRDIALRHIDRALLLETPPAPSDHGASGETLANLFREAGVVSRWLPPDAPRRAFDEALTAAAHALLATPSVPPEEGT